MPADKSLLFTYFSHFHTYLFLIFHSEAAVMFQFGTKPLLRHPLTYVKKRKDFSFLLENGIKKKSQAALLAGSTGILIFMSIRFGFRKWTMEITPTKRKPDA
jgi:hypothetical protein